MMHYKTGIGQDSHRFLKEESAKPCVIAGLTFSDVPGFDANSDGDIVFHAICNAISSITGKPILGATADDLCLEQGVQDSALFLKYAMTTLADWSIDHVALTIEAKRPKLKQYYDAIRASVARTLAIETEQVGIMATTGEELTGFGRGEGVQCIAIVTFCKKR